MKRVKVNILMTVLFCTGCLFWCPVSHADSIVIQFSSGKTQQVTLEDSADAMVNIQTQTTGTAGNEMTRNVPAKYLYIKESTREVSDDMQDKNTPKDNTSSIKLKWGAPKIGE